MLALHRGFGFGFGFPEVERRMGSLVSCSRVPTIFAFRGLKPIQNCGFVSGALRPLSSKYGERVVLGGDEANQKMDDRKCIADWFRSFDRFLKYMNGRRSLGFESLFCKY